MKRLLRKTHFSLQWLRILFGYSYYHKPQRLGRAFKPNELAGYFNDLTAKTQWKGGIDADGIPINKLADGRTMHFATTIVQKALGHWDQWLLTQNDAEKQEFTRLSYWLLTQQDEHGGWPVWFKLNIPSLSPYSAMTQGECISAFVRAWKLTGDSKFAEGAQRAFELLCEPIEDGGPAFYEGDELFLEEMPSTPRSSILNGWIFALFGLYDYWLAFKDREAQNLFQQSLNTLNRHLHEYDAGYWSYYDIKSHLASPFYHDLHIHQLHALSMVDEDPVLTEFHDRWAEYQRRWSNLVRALCKKVIQKLREPGEVVIIR